MIGEVEDGAHELLEVIEERGATCLAEEAGVAIGIVEKAAFG